MIPPFAQAAWSAPRSARKGRFQKKRPRLPAPLSAITAPSSAWCRKEPWAPAFGMKTMGRPLVRTTALHTVEDVRQWVGEGPDPVITTPVVTARGAGTTYPCCEPAPHIVSEKRGDVDVVTVVTEVPLSYSSIILKIDTDIAIGREGDRVFSGETGCGHGGNRTVRLQNASHRRGSTASPERTVFWWPGPSRILPTAKRCP